MIKVFYSMIIFALIAFSSLPQQAGDLDQSFGSNGIVITDVTDSLARDECITVEVDNSGYIYAGGSVRHNVGSFYLKSWMTVVRYNPDGTIDQSYGDGGKIFEYDQQGNKYCNDIALYGNNQNLVMAGWWWRTVDEWEPIIFRYDQLGGRDMFFGDSGEVWLSNIVPGQNAQAVCLAIQPDGKIVVGGLIGFSGSDSDYLILRLNPNGTLDNNFSGDGFLTGNFQVGSDQIQNLTLQSDGKILVTIRSQLPSNNYEARLVRFNPNGSLDTSFGTNGVVSTNYKDILSIALTIDSKILASAYGPSFERYLIRYNSDGIIDGSFNSGNPVTLNEVITKLKLQADGKIVGAGSVFQQGYIIQRLNEDGTYDNTFGTGGSVTVNFTPNGDIAYDLFIQNDRKILVGGVAWTSNDNRDFGLVRLLNDPIGPNIPFVIGDGINNQSFYNFSNLGSPPAEQVSSIVFPNTLPPNIPGDSPLALSVVSRYYDLSVFPENAGTSSNFSATLRLYYSDDELGTLDENKLKLIRHNGSGWDYVGGTVNTTDNYIEANNITSFNIFTFADPDSITLDINSELRTINEFRLEQNYPNPFNPSTKIRWQSPVSGYQILKIYDVLGNEVVTLVDEYLPVGSYVTNFNAEGLSSGIYFYKLQVGWFVETKKMILLH